jgi:hypothetical protein
LDQAATAASKESESNQIPPVVISLKRNQVLAREGDTVTSNTLAEIAAIKTLALPDVHPESNWPAYRGDCNLLGCVEIYRASLVKQFCHFKRAKGIRTCRFGTTSRNSLNESWICFLPIASQHSEQRAIQ